MCSTCEERKLYAIEHATVADVLRIERMSDETQQRAISGVGALLFDDLEAQITERADRENDEHWQRHWWKEIQPVLDSAVDKIEEVIRRMDAGRTLGAVDMDELHEAVDLIQRVAKEWTP